MKYKVVGHRAICGVATGGTLTREQIIARGGSVQHLLDTGHIVVSQESYKAVAKVINKKAVKADEKPESEETD